jgi:uncharacterized protein YegP (UPF0339 family)
MKKTYIAWYKIGYYWQFQLRSYNHEAIMTSEMYKQKAGMMKAITIIMNMEVVEVKETKNRNHEDFDLYD